MGKHRAYRVWLPEEEEALRLGVQKHGLGAWEQIRTDDAFPSLKNRTGVQLKDKWRNLVKFKHLTQAETACLASKSQKLAWKSENDYEEEEPMGEINEYMGCGPLPSVAVCCQQEIHATLLAREAHNIQIEANKALAAALAGVDRDVEGAEELMRNAVFVATQASEKAMKAKQHVVLARRRLGIALLRAEKDIHSETFMHPVGAQLGDGKMDATPSTSSNDGSNPANRDVVTVKEEASVMHESSFNHRKHDQCEGAAQSADAPKLACPCGTEITEGLAMCSCAVCGTMAHEDCLIMQATTEGRNFTKPYTCKECKSHEKDEEQQKSTSELADSDRDELFTELVPSPLKRKSCELVSSPLLKRACSGSPTTPTSKNEFTTIMGGMLGGILIDKISELQATLQGLQYSAQAFSPPTEISNSNSYPVNLSKVSHTLLGKRLFGHEMEAENTLLDTVLNDMSAIQDVSGLQW